MTFTKGWLSLPSRRRELHDPFRGSQLKAALAFLKAHRGQVSPITLTLWGNDLAPLSARARRAPKAIASFASRFDSILRAASIGRTGADIIVTGAWNPEVDQAEKTQPLYRSLDAAIARTAAGSRARVAKMYRGLQPSREHPSRLRALVHLLEGRSASERRRVPGNG